MSSRLNLQIIWQQVLRKYCQGGSFGRDPAPYFFNSRVQDLMFALNERRHELVFAPRKLGQKLEVPQYVYVTQEQLSQERSRIERRLWERLQVPPILSPRKPVERVLSRDLVLEGLSDSKLACVDISPDIPDRKRIICVREPNGTLRTATWDERSRLCQTFLPVEGRCITPPRMFFDPHLTDCLNRQQYGFVLDRACVQFEPDDPDYIRVTSATYDHVDSARHYQLLQSTRHFGALAFHLVWHRRIDSLLLHFIQLEQLQRAAQLIELFHVVHAPSATVTSQPISAESWPSGFTSDQSADSSSASDTDSDSEETEERLMHVIQEYIDTASVKRPVLELALQKHRQLTAQRRRVQLEVRRAHGLK